ncbi:receptor-like protein Cf-9 homolog [Mangifera indica]|uniref:receptor-like protein Cf-9 homolog n=1 Tax=Mangifera indica TaxID=29780 RepID=UPI001CFBC0EB|nr:receptor-like protein Cf-9 homolog [Mangifera indica]
MSWKEDNDCCSWDGVTCDSVTGHVIGLDLSCSWLYGNIPSNTSLFLLSQLKRLNLAFNDFKLSKIFPDFGRISSLTHLNLSTSNFSGHIPFEISHLSKLVTLDISNYIAIDSFPVRIERPVFERLVHNLTVLIDLVLDGVDMSSIVPSSMKNLSSSLTYLSLSDCKLQGNFLTHVFHLPNLQVLCLGGNFNLTGNFPKVNWSTPLKILDVSDISMSEQLPNSIGNLLHLRELYLQNCTLQGSIPPVLENLTQLTYLSLENNKFNGQIPSFLSNLANLYYLSLSNNNFSGQFPEFFFNLTQLFYLDLSSNQLTGLIPVCFVNSSQLSYLYLSSNQLTGPIPSFLSNLTNLYYLSLPRNNFIGQFPEFFFFLAHLSYLDLSSNQLTGPIPVCFVNSSQLSHLYLSCNQLTGPIPSFLSNLANLHDLSLWNNNFIGQFPDLFLNLTQLYYLDLSNNQLTGPIPSSIFEFVSLTTLALSSNSLSGIIEFHMFSKLKDLRYLSLSHNNLSVTTTEFNVNSSFPQLESLYLSACNISEFPGFLRSLDHLDHLDLSENKIHGHIPNWMLEIGKDTLSWLNLSHNSLTGTIQLPWKNLEYLDLHSNTLQGLLPIPQPYMRLISLSNNNFTGEIPDLICNMSFIEILDLSNNSLSGNIPECMGNFSSLHVLDLRKNRFNGSIPRTFAKGNNYRTLNFNNNELKGSIPRSLINCSRLEVLDLGNNKINDTFPYWLGNLPELQVLVLRSNKIYGSNWGCSKTKNCFSKLRIFDLSNNMISGFLPAKYFKNLNAMMDFGDAERRLQYMGEDYYQDSVMVTWKGFEYQLVKIITIFTTIDFSNNNFHGEIPKVIGKLHALRLLNLSQNNLTGCIPPSIGNMSDLESLDLSSNKLVGKIPWQLIKLNFLGFLNLSENHLSGLVPRDNHFDTFPNNSYDGNLALCGFPLSNTCETYDETPRPLSKSDDGESSNSFGWKAVLIGYGCGMVLGVMLGYLVFSTGKPQWVIRIVEGRQRRKGRRLNNKGGRGSS